MEIKHSAGLRGEISVAPDKSISHRAVILGAISKGTTEIRNFLTGADCLSTIDCFRKMGIPIEITREDVKVYGKGMHGLKEPEELLYTGNSGTTTRLLCGLLSPQRFSCTLDGDESIRKRPMNRVIDPLRMMGADLESSGDGYTPIRIRGTKLKAIDYLMPVASAQLKSSLILAGLYAEGNTVVTEPMSSRNHTELMINGFGGRISVRNHSITVCPAEELYAREVRVPGDISSAAFFMVAAMIVPNSEIRITNVGLNETRTGIIEVLKEMGGLIEIEYRQNEIEPSGDVIVRSSELHGIEIGGTIIPRLIDELPVLSVAAAFAKGTTVIRNAEELKVKESNRIDTMARELGKAGADVTPTQDGMIIKGGKDIKGAVFESYQDHRIAMSLSVLALAAEGTSRIQNHQCITISYPDFFDTLKEMIQ